MKISDFSLWEAFYWVAKEESFTKAAQRLKIGVPILSKKIARLEESIELRLFLRSTRKVSLTDEGKSMIASVETLLEDYRGFEDRLEPKNEISGTIRLTCTSGLANRILAPLIVEFCRLYPKIKFDIDASDRMVHLIESQMDLAIRIQPPPDNSDLIYRRLGENKLIFCASPNYLDQSRLPLKKISDLHLHPLIMFDAYLNCAIKGEEMTLRDFEKSRRVDANSGTFLTEMALQGAGIAVRSLWDIRDFLNRGELKRVLSKFEIVNPQSIYAVVPGRRLMTSRVRLFLSFLEQKAKAWG